MSSNITWDINKYKYEHELEHHWQLRKMFMLAHYDKFPENQLVSLAQTFYNVEVLGCSYDEAVMKKLRSLSSGMTYDRVSKEKEKFTRGFVPASDAVVEKVRGKPVAPVEIHDKDKAMKPMDFVRGDKLLSVPQNCGIKRNYPENSREESIVPNSDKPWLTSIDPVEVMKSGPFGRAVIFKSAVHEESFAAIIERTAAASQMITNFAFTLTKYNVRCLLELDGLYLANGAGSNQKAAKDDACKIGLERLKETSFTILVKSAFKGNGEVDRELSHNDSSNNEPASSFDMPIKEDNIGNKMMKLMGWSGGGLGKDGQGLTEPVKPTDRKISRAGLGTMGEVADFRRKARNLLEQYSTSESKEDLVFSSEFSKEERKIIHDLVRQFHLKSRSYGKEETGRQIVVFKKVTPLEIIQDLIKCGGETDKYVLEPPTAYLQKRRKISY